MGGELVGGNTHSFSQSLFNLHNPVLMGSGGEKGDTEGRTWRRGEGGWRGEEGEGPRRLRGEKK